MQRFAILVSTILAGVTQAANKDGWERADIALANDDQITDEVSAVPFSSFSLTSAPLTTGNGRVLGKPASDQEGVRLERSVASPADVQGG